MASSHSTDPDLAKRVRAIERYLWGDDIDKPGFSPPPPPAPGGLAQVIADSAEGKDGSDYRISQLESLTERMIQEMRKVPERA